MGVDDFRACADSASMKRGRADTIIEEVRGVVSRWMDYAEEVNVAHEWRDKIANTLRMEKFE